LIEDISSAEELAIYPVLMGAMLFFPLATTIFMSGLRRYVTAAYALGDEQRVTQLVSTIFRYLLLLATLMLVVGLLMSWKISSILTIDERFAQDAQIMFALLATVACLRVCLAPLSLGFDLRQKFLSRNLIGLGSEVLRLTILLALLSISPRVLWMVVATVAANLVEIFLALRVSMRLAPCLRVRFSEVRPEIAGPMFSFGGWAVLGRIGFLIRDASDPLILNELGTPTDVIAFHVGSMPDNQSRRIYLEAFSTLQPALTAMSATGQIERMRRVYYRFCRYAMWMMCFMAGSVLIMREELLRLYLPETSTKYTVAATVAALLLARALVIFPNSLIGMFSVAKAEIKPVALRAIFISCCNLALTFYLVGALELGAVGAALATLIVTFLGAPLLMWPLGLRLTDSKFSDWLGQSLLPGCIPLVFGLPLWIGARRWIEPDTWLELCYALAIGGLGYVLGIWLLAMRAEDRAELKKLRTKLGTRLSKRRG